MKNREVMTQRSIARRLSVSRSFVSRILRGKERVSPEMAARFEQLTGVPPMIWLYGKPEVIIRELEKAIKAKIRFGRGRPRNDE